jgi:hypothetical protein
MATTSELLKGANCRNQAISLKSPAKGEMSVIARCFVSVGRTPDCNRPVVALLTSLCRQRCGR